MPVTLTAQEHVKATSIYYAPYVQHGHQLIDHRQMKDLFSTVKELHGEKDTHMHSETRKQWQSLYFLHGGR